MSTISPLSNTELKWGLFIRYKGGTTWTAVFKTENIETEITTVNMATYTWYCQATLAISNADMQVQARLNVNTNIASSRVFLALAEAWDFVGQRVKITYFSESQTGPLFYHGSIGRIDYVGGYFDTATNLQADETVLSWMLPGTFLSYQTSHTGSISLILKSPSTSPTEQTAQQAQR